MAKSMWLVGVLVLCSCIGQAAAQLDVEGAVKKSFDSLLEFPEKMKQANNSAWLERNSLFLLSHLKFVVSGQNYSVPELEKHEVSSLFDVLSKRVTSTPMSQGPLDTFLKSVRTEVESSFNDKASCYPLARRLVSAFFTYTNFVHNWTTVETKEVILLSEMFYKLHRRGYVGKLG
jgi:hypothetical protein